MAAWLENDGAPVDLRGVIMARLASGGLVTMNACGRAVPSCASEIRVFCERATILTGIWGERLEIQRAGDPGLVPVPSASQGTVWDQFLDVRDGRMPNPSPPEVGLRMALLWDAIRASAARGGSVVRPTLLHPITRSGGDGMTTRVTIWNEFRQEHSDEPVRRIYPDGIHVAIADGLRDGAGRHDPHRHARRAGARPDRGGAGGDRRADLVGPRRPPRGVRCGRGPRPAPGAAGDGPDRPALGALLADLPAPDGHLVRPDLARGRRPRAAVGGGSGAPASRRAWAPGSCCPRRRCTGSTSTSPRPTTWCS